MRPCPSVLWQLAEQELWVTDTSKDEEGPQTDEERRLPCQAELLL